MFLYSISDGPILKHAFGLIVISKILIWKSYQTQKQMKKKKKKNPDLKSQTSFWLKKMLNQMGTKAT